MSLIPVSQAAEQLGVSTRQVQHLVAIGTLRQLARGVLDEASVDRYRAVRGRSHGRAWTVATAWGAVALLSGVAASWMGVSQRSRLRSRLHELSAPELVAHTRERADVTRYRGHRSVGSRLAADLVRADLGQLLGLVDSPNVDGYLGQGALELLVREAGLIRDDDGWVTLRATTFDIAIVQELASGSSVLGALDLAESLDPRERRAGVDALEHALARIRG